MVFQIKKGGEPLKILKALKKDVSIKHMIHKSLAGWEEPRPHGTIHASELMKDLEFCPREWAFLDMGLVKKKGNFLGTAMRITFDHGRDMEYRLRNEWLRQYMVGHWECEICGYVHEVFGTAPKIGCPKCGYAHKWAYKEVRLLDPVSGVSGGIDGFVDVGEKKFRLLEVKSMDKDQHKVLEAPLMEHKFRTSLYLRLADYSENQSTNRINTDVASILYVSKSYGFKDETLKAAGIGDAPFSPIKEFDIMRQDSLSDTPLNKATALTQWRNDDMSPSNMPCGVCPNAMTKRAQSCPAAMLCFSGKYSSTITWMDSGKPKHEGKTKIAER